MPLLGERQQKFKLVDQEATLGGFHGNE